MRICDAAFMGSVPGSGHVNLCSPLAGIKVNSPDDDQLHSMMAMILLDDHDEHEEVEHYDDGSLVLFLLVVMARTRRRRSRGLAGTSPARGCDSTMQSG